MAIEVIWSDGLDASVRCNCKLCSRKNGNATRCAGYKKAMSAVYKEEQKRFKAETARQKALAAKPRSSAKSPSLAKLGQTLSARKVNDWYGRYGLPVLCERVVKYGADRDDVLESHGPFLKRLGLCEQRGKPKVYEIVRPLPEVKAFENIRDIKFTTTIKELIDSANDTVQDITSQMRDWFDNMPEGFQNGDKGSEVDECATELENMTSVEFDEFPEAVSDAKVIHLPILDQSSRGDAMAEAAAAYRAAAAALDKLKANFTDGEQDVFRAIEQASSECVEAADSCENISFPGMY